MGGEAILKMLRTNRTIVRIELEGNEMGRELLNAIGKRVSNQKSLEYCWDILTFKHLDSAVYQNQDREKMAQERKISTNSST
jgi:Ran GTPase-activating protein (RanGAP) involved in mRNA processing and transport